jgi:hypothetical protein
MEDLPEGRNNINMESLSEGAIIVTMEGLCEGTMAVRIVSAILPLIQKRRATIKKTIDSTKNRKRIGEMNTIYHSQLTTT